MHSNEDYNLILFPSSKNFEVQAQAEFDGPPYLPQSIFVGDFPQLNFEIDLMNIEELISLIEQQEVMLTGQHARLRFFINELYDALN